ncbi:hypothetical protein ABL78_1726 [Leptomonas seymouri]|uniref:B box-type domain-containing protein n=1 Tax=Leptomonas seymouri TaxID=5684 RepID=A0A0N1I705_LEPSE|nr:hypothetical protein ABL78_1726 [Leptomonas seymouri]|eukprot:KPI89163.1 hypothetical protein ABL78_1726 [Leptomonas seymouri]
MAGLQSQNISVASIKLSGPSTSDRDVCVFCRRRATPPASDPHAPLFPFFSLVDCRHYACQPCALVHCDNAGRCIFCPQCNCVSRLAQSGRRRNRSSSQDAAGAGDNDANRVWIDDGVSSVRSHRSATVKASPHRSAIKGQSGSSKRRSNSVQFPANPTTSIIDAETASVMSNNHNDAAEGDEGRRATSPLTQDAVAALPIDPSEARRQRLRDQQQRRAAAAAAQAEKSVSLYAITAAPPKPLSATLFGDPAQGAPARRSKERSHSQPAPKLPNTILEPKQVFPAPPPLVLHTIDEDELASIAAREAPVTRSPRSRAQLEDCEAAESEVRGVLDAVEEHERTKLRQSMEEAETAIHARRGLEVEFESTPRPLQPEQQPTDLSDQVSATSDDELSQRSSARKFGSGVFSHRNHRTPRGNVVDGVGAGGAAAAVTNGIESQKGRGESQLNADTPANVPSIAKLVAGAASAVDTPSPMTAARATRPSEAEEAEDQAIAKLDAEEAHRSRAREFFEQEAEERKQEFLQQRERLSKLEHRTRAQIEADAADEKRLLSQQQERRMQQLHRARELREREAEEEEQHRQQQQQERMSQQEERNAFARRLLEDREALERDALFKTEAAVRTHYERNAEEWRTALIPHALEAQRRARYTASTTHQQQQQLEKLQVDERAERTNAKSEEEDEWAWLMSGARVDRVLAATEESERVQREYDELRYERILQKLQQDAAELVVEEQRGRHTIEEYEVATRNVLESHCRVQRDAAVAEEERLRSEAAQKSAARREVVLQQRWQREREELDADEIEGRSIVREEEREERRTASMMFVQGVAAVRRRTLLANLTNSVPHEEREETVLHPDGAVSVPSVAHIDTRAPVEWSVSSEVPTVIAAGPPQQQTDASRISADQLEELRVRQVHYEDEMRAAMQRLQEAERRLAEEAAIRIRAEEERRASQAESERLLREAEQRAEQRIRDARDAAERLAQAQLADVRDEAARRAEHAAVMQALAEEEQRAVLEAKLQAAERQLQQAQQRAAEEVQRARDEAAEMAAAEAAQAAREVQRREEEWQEHARAEKLLRLAEQESEKADAIRRLSELEARAAEAVRLAREEAARSAAAMEERIAEMERRQQAREVEVQQASQRVCNARGSVRDFDLRSPSSRHTTPSMREGRVASPQQPASHRSSRRASVSIVNTPSRSERGLAASASVSAESRHAVAAPPLAPSLSQRSSFSPRATSAQQALISSVVPVAESASTPPHVMLGANASTPLSFPSAQTTSLSRQQAPLSSAASASGGGLHNFDPADVVRAAIREAVMEIIAAQQRALSLQDEAEQHVELSARRFRRRKSDQMQAAHEVAELEASRLQSEHSASPHSEQQQQQRRRTPHDPSARVSCGTPSPRSEHARSGHNEESLMTQFSVLSPAGVAPVPSATAAMPGCVISSTMSNTSSIYFDDQPFWTAGDRRGNVTSAVASTSGLPGQQQHQRAAVSVVQPHRSASRMLFPAHHPHWDSAAAVGVPAGQDLYRDDYGYPLPQSRVGDGGHTYNEPEPSKPASVTVEHSHPPPRRSTTRAATECGQPYAIDGVPTAQAAAPAAPTMVTNTETFSAGALSQPSRVCPRCHRSETTSLCWRCGEVICRHCGLRPGSARKLCCSAHIRAQLRDYTRQSQQTSQPARGNQQVQTSFRSSTDGSDNSNIRDETFVVAPDRYHAGTSTQEPPSLIPPSAYYRAAPLLQPPQEQQQQQPRQYYFDHPGLYTNPVSVAAMTAVEPIAYSSVDPRMPYAYPGLYPPQPMQPQWSWQPAQFAGVPEGVGFANPSPFAQQQMHAQPQPQPQQQQPANQTPTPPPAVQSQPVWQRVVDVAVEEDRSSHAYQTTPADAAVLRALVSPHHGKGRTSSASSRNSAVASSAATAARAAHYHQHVKEASGSASNRQAPGLTTAQPPTSVLVATPVKEGGQMHDTEGEKSSSTPNGSQAALQEPKTERKQAISAFFVPLDGGSEEPRRPKPPAPRNYVPSKMFPPDAVRAAAAAMAKQNVKKAPKLSSSPQAVNTRGQSGGVFDACRHVSPPLRAQTTRPALHDPYAAREHSARPQSARSPVAAPQRRASPRPYGQTRQHAQRQQRAPPHARLRSDALAHAPEPQPVIVSYMKAAVPMHPHFAEVRKDAETATSVSKPPAQVSQQHRRWSKEEVEEDSYSSYTTSTLSTVQPPMDTRASNEQPTYQQDYGSAKDRKGAQRLRDEKAHRELRYHSASPPHIHRQHRDPHGDEGVGGAGYLPQRPHLQPSQRPQKAVDTPFYLYNRQFTATTETQPTPRGPRQDEDREQQHRHAYRWSDPSTVSFNAPERRVPTLAELDRRLQELRAQDEYEAVQHQQRQSRLWRSASPQQQRHQQQPSHPSAHPQLYVLLETPGCVPRPHHRSRSPQLRTVSPPWRTDLNSSPIRPRWDISQPHSPVYHPPAAAAGH